MRFKKIFLATAILAATGFSLAANADLTITNQTATDSAVKINGVCSGYLGLDTPPGTSKSYNIGEITSLCGSGFSNCTATIYTTKYCTSAPIGTANVTSSLVVSSATISSPYSLGGVGTNSVTLSG